MIFCVRAIGPPSLECKAICPTELRWSTHTSPGEPPCNVTPPFAFQQRCHLCDEIVTLGPSPSGGRHVVVLPTCMAVLAVRSCAPSPRPQRRLGNWSAAFAALTDLRSRANFPADPAGNRCPLVFPVACRARKHHTRKEPNHEHRHHHRKPDPGARDPLHPRRPSHGPARRGGQPALAGSDHPGVAGGTSFFDVICWRDLAENVALSLTKGMRVVVTGRLEQRSWETDEGEHRSKVELTADEIGPSLRFATADVHRTERRGAEAETQQRSRPSEPDQGPGERSSGPSVAQPPARSHLTRRHRPAAA